ncbi:HAD family hydrolase [Senegalia massiliensis]|uniref:HAD family phosphatase n=1 Tax=Senegalia massiliensis TaxID=1720316 RepID=A0A845QU52_9CLOT|nr:HAD family phosphatase [Senegalia massiliensis]NBI05540.1 HAD family phosphatase [Senegalia massiliensis]
MIKAFIFDMDGVIVNSEPELVKIEIEYMANFGVEITKKDLDEFVGTNSYYMFDKLKKKYNLNKTVNELVDEVRGIYLDHIQLKENVNAINGVIPLIKDLHNKGIKMVVASSSPVSWIEKIIETLEIREYFQELISGDFVKDSKPAPDIFLYALDKLKVKKEEAIVIEDSENGVKAANNAGIKVIGYEGDETSNQNLSHADMVIKDFNELDLDELLK